ncbi:MAG: hypothetical protein ACI8VW_002735, partial [bacterium]
SALIAFVLLASVPLLSIMEKESDGVIDVL